MMNKILLTLCGVGLILCSCRQMSAQEEAEANAPEGMVLVWNDEFDVDGPPGDDWTYEEGFVRNEELQWYQKQNARCEDGCLVIEGRKERVKNPRYEYYVRYLERMEQNNTADTRPARRPWFGDWRSKREYAEYTSSSVTTKGMREFLFGRFEVRARIPKASGSWPAIWTLGLEHGWPACGEIDIMEYYLVNGQPTILANTAVAAERGEKWNTGRIPLTHFLEKDKDWPDKFHTWRMDWDSTAVRLYLDDELLNESLIADTWNERGEPYNPFLHPQYLLLNLALGASGGEPDTTAFPLRYEIDWVRVYQTPAQRVNQDGTSDAFNPGKVWRDVDGKPINAHGGGVLAMPDKYYWFGEHKGSGSTNAYVGVTCYSSTDLLNWKYEGVALAVSDSVGSPLEKGCVIERPKVVYNAATGKYVMWFHLELNGKGYDSALAAVAVSDTPTGPYTFVNAERPNAGCLTMGMNEDELTSLQNRFRYLSEAKATGNDIADGYYFVRDMKGGQMSRDQTVFVDDDGKGYRIFSAEENYTLNIAELSDDYLSHTGRWVRAIPAGHNEAPAIFKKDSLYWMITSGCTGWTPNRARMFSAPSIWGPWTAYESPCTGKKSEITFGGQSTYILPVSRNGKTTYIFMADLWKPQMPSDSRYLWLPVSFNEDGVPVIPWQESWKL